MQIGTKEVRLLQALHFLESPTRSEIARFSGLSAVSVTSHLNALLEAGIIGRVGKTSSRSGRPSTIYRVRPTIGYSVGVFLEASSFRVAAIDPSGQVLHTAEHTLALSSNAEDHLEDIDCQVAEEVTRLAASKELAGRVFLSLGIAPPGMVDTNKGLWLHGLRVAGITHIDLKGRYEEKFGVPVTVEDPARCISWLERARAGGQVAEPLVVLYLGEGVGAGMVLKGELYRGASGLAGEIGHMHVAEDGDRCSCGNIGCLEMVVSQASILRRFRRLLQEGVITTLQLAGEDGLTLGKILEAAQTNDRLARSTLYDLGLVLGDACATLIELYNPRTLLIGGSVGTLAEFLKDAIELRVGQRVIPEMLAEMHIGFPRYDAYDEAVGAAMIAERRFWAHLEPSRAIQLLRSAT